MNTCNLIGRLTADPEVKTVLGEQTVCNFTLAVNRRYKDKNGNRQADFLRCVAWNRTAEMISRYLAKGDQCGVSGSIQSRSYTAQDGSTRYVTEIAVEAVTLCGSRRGDASSGEASARGKRQNQRNATSPEESSANGGFEDYNDELPF